MLQELLRALSHDQKTELYKRHIRPQLLSDWKNGRRLPTEVQVADVAEVTGAEWADLQAEITVMRAPEERREEIARAIKWRKRSHTNQRRARVSGLFHGHSTGNGRRVGPVHAKDRALDARQVAAIVASKGRH